MNIEQADKVLLDGEWSDIIQDIIYAMRRYRDNGPIIAHSPMYDRWSLRIECLEQALEV